MSVVNRIMILFSLIVVSIISVNTIMTFLFVNEPIYISIVTSILIFSIGFLFSRRIMRPYIQAAEHLKKYSGNIITSAEDPLREEDFIQVHVKEVLSAANSNRNELEASKKIIAHQQHHDILTGLPNRHYLNTYISDALNTLLYQNDISLVFIDIDRFKDINDTEGDHAGNMILKELAQCLKSSFGKEHFIARQSGDEFSLVISNSSRKEVEAIARRVMEQLEEPFTYAGRDHYIRCSIGISHSEANNPNIALQRHADLALGEAKNNGGNQYIHYHVEMEESKREQIEIERRLRQALELNQSQFHVYYQPKVQTMTKQIVGVEALVRWNEPDLGMISPGVFIPIAEQAGLINMIWEVVMNEACSQIIEWNNLYGKAIPVSVNFSATQFMYDDLLVEKVKDILYKYDMPPNLLEIEITESVLFSKDSSDKLREFEDMGIKIAVDDFGTGYSSLSYLVDLPIHTIKLDKSFIQMIQKDWKIGEVASAIIKLAHRLNLNVVAEGVEDEMQLSYLIELKCDVIQGYYIAKPLSSSEFRKSFIMDTLPREIEA
ncbi:putative bifunctional diguanylate cyclase/phosphodiesterase [Rossellomorea arthrocnemi]|uniref:putative bifunctional diguanylate cyclase/phosphodiesterase n=1 Tax=Rossellomorea arthrocnemi TaxID=2769542 RepID=UPI00191888B7|nr:EAL domain-containing protein [Rossellomorea arthrocnemi]